MIPRTLLLTLSLLVFTSLATAQTTTPQTPAEALATLFEDYKQWQYRSFPGWAMDAGDYRYADRLADPSLDAIEKRHEATRDFLRRLRTIDRGGLGEQDLVSCELFELELRTAIDGHQYREFLSPITGRSGPLQDVPQMAERVRFESAGDYVNYLQRLELVPWMIDHQIDLMERGLREGRTPPKVTMAGIPDQLRAIVEGEALSVLGAPFKRFPSHLDNATRRELTTRFENQSLPAVQGAMRSLSQFMNETYIPGCRESTAATDLPDGAAYYDFQLQRFTTTAMTAQEIHALGVSEVARIRREMLEVIRRSDFMEQSGVSALSEETLFRSFLNYLRTDSRFYHDSEEALLQGYRDICKRVDGELPKYFGVLPRLSYGVRPMPRFAAGSQTTAYYQPGDLRNAQAGFFVANTFRLDQRPKYEMIPLAMHEAVPGHHLQIALAQELGQLPEFRRQAYFVAFGEGWALYSERLGIEMGLYRDPYDDFGRLLYEMWRACRLVVDPGMHAMGWTRQRAIDFMTANTALSELNIRNEVDRYIAWPGQACGYKIGELRIRALRAEAEEALGPRFDRRTFHDVVLGAGSVPLPVLERRVRDWIQARAASPE